MKQRGFTLVEVLVTMLVFMIVAVAVYRSYSELFRLLADSRAVIAANNLANEQFEIIRNMSYASVGLVGGVPAGLLPRTQTFVRDGYTFYSTTTIRNVHDPYDTNIANADYKSVFIDIGCPLCKGFTSRSFSGLVAPVSLSAAVNSGALFVQVLDASGKPVPQANVHITNSATVPTIDILEQTDNDGMYRLINTPASDASYRTTITKSGYSSMRTYQPGSVENPHPENPDLTVVDQQLTQTSFAIDTVSTVNVETVTASCEAVPTVQFTMTGEKIIGTDINDVPIYKQVMTKTTNESGVSAVTNVEWDGYGFIVTNGTYELAGTIPPMPLVVAPDSTQPVQLVLMAKNTKSVLFTVKDSASGETVEGATILLTATGFSASQTTGVSGQCTPPGQTLFQGLQNATYSFAITKSGYQTASGEVVVGDPSWQNKIVIMQTQ